MTSFERAQVQHGELIELLSEMAKDSNAGVVALAEFGVEFASRHQPLPGPGSISSVEGGIYAPIPLQCTHGRGLFGIWAQALPGVRPRVFTTLGGPVIGEHPYPQPSLHVCTHNRGCRTLAHGQAVTWDGQGFTTTGGTPALTQHYLP